MGLRTLPKSGGVCGSQTNLKKERAEMRPAVWSAGRYEASAHARMERVGRWDSRRRRQSENSGIRLPETSENVYADSFE